MRLAPGLLLLQLLLLVGNGSGVPAPDRTMGWPDLWGLLRSARDTTAASKTIRSGVVEQNKTDAVVREPPPQRSSAFGHVRRDVTERMANVFISVRSSLRQLTGSAGDGEVSTTMGPPTDLDVRANASSDVLGKEVADKMEPLDVASRRNGQPQQKQAEESQSFMSSALERVRGAGRTFTEMGRAVGRWGKAMADSVVGTTVNSAVGTVLQVIKGGKPDDDADHVCFPDLGCFSLLEPWTSSKRPLPRMNAPEDIQTRFFLYTRNVTSPEEAVSLTPGNDTVANATALLQGVKTFFVVHGFNDKTTAVWVQDLKDTLLSKVDGNVVLVDWAPGAQASRNYLQAASNTRVVGAELARLVDLLAESLPMDSVHVIGHSLGAHAAGYAGKQLGGRLGRITALDAAQPAFEDQVPEVRVAVGDAVFVDVIHTNGVPFIPTLGLGVMHPVGDVDFYLNGGTVQPGCFVPKLPPVQSLLDLAALPGSVLADMLSCSHRRAIEYFDESIRSDCLMWGRRRMDYDNDESVDKKDPVAAESAPSGSRTRQDPWWSPSGLGGLLAGVFSAGGKDKISPTETPPSTGPGRPSKGFSFSFPFFATMFSSDSRRVATDGANKRKKYVRPVDGNGIADGNKGDYPISAPSDSLTPDSKPNSSRSRLSVRRTKRPPPDSPTWCEKDCLPMGLDTDLYLLKGTFNVLTADRAPYCMSQESNEVE